MEKTKYINLNQKAVLIQMAQIDFIVYFLSISGMRNPSLPQPKEITNQIHQLIGINSLQMQPPHSLIEAQNPNR